MTSKTMTLTDGRTLSWAEVGAESGPVVLANHGTGSSRLELTYHDAALRELGLHVIAPERPGYGASSPMEGPPSVSNRVADVAQLVDALGIDRFAVYGYSRGGVDALALAASQQLGGRVTRVVLSAPGALGQPARHELEREIRERVALADWRGFVAWFEAHGEPVPTLAPADEEAFATPDYLEAAMATLAEGAAQGSIGRAGDAWTFATPQFELASIALPVDIFHGTADTAAPIAHGRALAAGLPRVTLHERPDEGHYSIGRYVPEFMRLLA